MSNSPFSALTKEQAFALVDAVIENDELTLTASAYEGEKDEWIFEASCDHEPDLEIFHAIAKKILGGKVDFSSKQIDANFDWVSKSLEGLKPVSAGGFYVHGSHDKGNVPAGLIKIKIDAAQAFGTGHHETTTGCLEAIEIILEKENPKKIIDIGTGTGVLAIALAKKSLAKRLLAKKSLAEESLAEELKVKIIASDIDPIAVQITKENAANNNVAKYLKVIEATGVDHKKIAKNAPYDLIVANILALPLVNLAPNIQKISAKGAKIILSGILTTQAAKVITAYGQQGIKLEKRLIRGDWTTLILKKT